MIPKFIQTAADLQTPHRDICSGFLIQAFQKTDQAEIYIKEANKFYDMLKNTQNIDELLNQPNFFSYITSACGFSQKAQSHLTQKELIDVIKKVLMKISKETGEGFREDLLYRYLLTKGDSLGGRMRNLTGAYAGIKLTDIIRKRLSAKKKEVKVEKNESGKVKKLTFHNRILLFDVTPKLIGKNIDVIMIDNGGSSVKKNKLLANESKYIACGELKGGIDPAGADEHWKTANTAFGRIRTTFKKRKLGLFFIGGVIEISMANEIFNQLKCGELTHAANLYNEKQLTDLVDWLLSL